MPKPYGGRKKRIMRKFRISEISGVDVPAQEGATVLIMKRDASANRPRDLPVSKGSVVQAVTSEVDGHQHGISIRRYGDGATDIWVDGAQAEGADSSHSHSLLVSMDGTYEVVQNAGHTHDIDSTALAAAIVACVAKSEGEETDMTPEEIVTMKAENERLERVVELSPEHRKHFDGIGTIEGQNSWLAKLDAERDEVIKKDAEDPVVHTTKDGLEIRKSDGPTVLAMAKKQDEQADELARERSTNATLRKAAETAAFEKRAETELAHLPGTVPQRAALLKAAESIEDEETRTAAVAALKAQNAAQAPAFGSYGTAAGGDTERTAGKEGNPQAKLDELTKAYQKNNDGVTFEQAQAAVLGTTEGAELYAQIARH